MATPKDTCISLKVSNLHPDVTEAILYKEFLPYGNDLSIRVCRDSQTDKSLGYAWVNFQTRNEAEFAMESLNYKDIHGLPCRIKWAKKNFVDRSSGITNNLNFNHEKDSERAKQVIDSKLIRHHIVNEAKLNPRNHENPLNNGFTNCLIGNIPTHINNDSLKKMFEQYGEIVSAKIKVYSNSISKRFGYVNFKEHEKAAEAIKYLNGTIVGDKKIYVKWATIQPPESGVKLDIGNLGNNINDDRLIQEFIVYGNITSVKVWKNKENNTSKGFVCFSTLDEANRAMSEMNGKIVDDKTLYVTLAPKNKNKRMEREMYKQIDSETSSKIANVDTMEVKQIFKEKLYPLVSKFAGDMADPITEMFLELDNAEIRDLIKNENSLRMKVEQILVVMDLDEGESEETGSTAVNEESEIINILLLGETGVGKSTFLNGLINYMTYSSFEDAVNGEPIIPIRSKFNITNSNCKSKTVIYGNDDDTNEAFGTIGHSVTQMPKSYILNIKNKRIRIIDTPGIGDTDGIEKDLRNMHNIVAYLSNLKDVNGIIFLLKPNDSRLNVTFKFGIQQLLLHLHKEACKNMVFCFTNCRSTHYKPGETYPLLQALLNKIKSIDIKLTKDTIYCIDNESIRFLMAMKTIKFENSEKKDYAASWKKAVEESTRLIQYISNLPPHSIQMTVSINEARRSIINQSRPIAHIADCIQENISAIKSKQMEKISIESSKAELHDQLKVEYSTLKIKDLDYPRTVCTAPKCVEVVSKQIHYKTICHKHCYIETEKNIVRCVALKNCAAIDASIGKCRECSCSWEFHMHITYDVEVEIVMEEDENIKKLIDGKDGNLKINEYIQKHLKKEVNQYTKDKQRLIEINAYFMCFLQHNAIIPYNDALLDYLDHLIEIKKAEPYYSKNTIDNLESLKNVYRQEIEVIENALKTSTDAGQSLDVKKIEELMSELKQLHSIQKILKNGWSDIDKANYAVVEMNDKHINVKQKGIRKEYLRK